MRFTEDHAKDAAIAAEGSYAPINGGGPIAAHRNYEVRGQPHAGCFAQCFSCTCNDRGGCCRQAPAQIIVTQDGAIQRINLIIHVQAACDNSRTGLADQLPPELLERLSAAELQPWLDDLQRVNRIRHPGCAVCWGCFFCAFVPCIWMYCCRQYHDEVIGWNDALVEWQKRMNAELLAPKGMLIKTQSHCHAYYDKVPTHTHTHTHTSSHTRLSHRSRPRPVGVSLCCAVLLRRTGSIVSGSVGWRWR